MDRPSPEDSTRTVPNVSSAPGVSEEGLLRGTATAIEMGKDSQLDDFRFTTKKLDRPITGGPKTDTLPA